MMSFISLALTKTVEFKTHFNRANEATINQWLIGLRRVWNMGLEQLEESQQWYWREKAGLTDDPFPVPLKWVVNEVDNKKEFALACDITADFSRRYGKADQLFESPYQDYRLTCPIKRSPGNQPPALEVKGRDPFLSLCTYFAFKKHRDKLWLIDIPSVFVRGTLKSLSKAWEEFKKGQREKPKFKSSRKPIKTLVNNDCADSVKIEGDRIRLPKLGWLTCKTLAERWQSDVAVKTAKICLRPSGVYIQLTGSVPTKQLKPSQIACGLDVGLEFITSDDVGKTVNPPKYYRKQQKRLRRLQRKVARQQKGSNRLAKTRKLVARTHERIADQRRLFNHKISTYTVRQFGGIAVEDIKIANLVRRPKPVESEEGSGKWLKNNAAAKSGLNKSFADAGLGQLLTFIEQKAKTHEREFIKVSAAYTSQDCPSCGNRQKKALSQRTHKCEQCGYATKRDHAAAQNIKAKAEFSKKYRSSVRKFKPVETSVVESMKREGLQNPLGNDVAAPQFIPIQLALSLDIIHSNNSSDFSGSKLPQKSRKSSVPRKAGSKPKRGKELSKQGLLPLWEVD